MEQKEKDIRKKETYEKPEVESEDCEIWVYGYSSGPSDARVRRPRLECFQDLDVAVNLDALGPAQTLRGLEGLILRDSFDVLDFEGQDRLLECHRA